MNPAERRELTAELGAPDNYRDFWRIVTWDGNAPCWFLLNVDWDRPELKSRRYSLYECAGQYDACHLIPKALIRRERHALAVRTDKPLEQILYDPRIGVAGCRWQHGLFDLYRLTVPRERLPEVTELAAAEYGLEWFLERRFGPR